MIVRGASGAFELELEALRRDFDQAFAGAPRQAETKGEGVLAISVGVGRYLVRSSEIAGVGTTGKLVRVPSRTSGLLGVTGVRGALLPVFSLAALLGEAPGDTAPGWLMLVGREEPLAFAFHGIEGYRTTEFGAGIPVDEANRAHPCLREVATIDEGVVPVIHVPSLVSSVRGGKGREGTKKEGI